MNREVSMVMSDPRNSQGMRAMIDLIRATSWAFWDIREMRQAERRRLDAERRRQSDQRMRLARQQVRLRAMTDEELHRASIQWSGSVCYPELRRRGLPVPGERTGA